MKDSRNKSMKKSIETNPFRNSSRWRRSNGLVSVRMPLDPVGDHIWTCDAMPSWWWAERSGHRRCHPWLLPCLVGLFLTGAHGDLNRDKMWNDDDDDESSLFFFFFLLFFAFGVWCFLFVVTHWLLLLIWHINSGLHQTEPQSLMEDCRNTQTYSNWADRYMKQQKVLRDHDVWWATYDKFKVWNPNPKARQMYMAGCPDALGMTSSSALSALFGTASHLLRDRSRTQTIQISLDQTAGCRLWVVWEPSWSDLSVRDLSSELCKVMLL
jgi:hypothetical protein